MSPATTNLRLAALRKLLVMAEDLGLISWRVKLPKVKPQPVEDRSGPTEEEYRALLKAATDPQERCLIRLMGDAGLRVSEALSIRREDVVRGQNGRITGVKAIRKGSDGSRSFCPVAAQTAQAVEAVLACKGKGEDPIVGGTSPTWARKVVRRVAKRAGITRRMTCHGCRHRLGSNANRVSNGNITAVAALLRHSDPRTAFEAYIDDKEEQAAALIEQTECKLGESE